MDLDLLCARTALNYCMALTAFGPFKIQGVPNALGSDFANDCHILVVSSLPEGLAGLPKGDKTA